MNLDKKRLELSQAQATKNDLIFEELRTRIQIKSLDQEDALEKGIGLLKLEEPKSFLDGLLVMVYQSLYLEKEPDHRMLIVFTLQSDQSDLLRNLENSQGGSTSKDVLRNVLYYAQEETEYFFGALHAFAIDPFSSSTLSLICFVLSIAKDDKFRHILETMKEWSIENAYDAHSDSHVMSYFTFLFYGAKSRFRAQERFLPLVRSFCHFLEEIGKRDLIIALWLYYQYRDKKKALGILEEHLVSTSDDFGTELTSFKREPRWPCISKEALDSRCKKLLSYQSEEKLQNYVKNSLARLSGISLIATIYEIRKSGNVRLEVILLRLLSKSLGGEVAFTRLEELTGFAVSPKVPKTSGTLPGWMDSRSQKMLTSERKVSFSEKDKTILSEMFHFFFLDAAFVTRLFELDNVDEKSDACEMYSISIARLESKVILEKLLSEALLISNQRAIRLVAQRLVVSNQFQSLLAISQHVISNLMSHALFPDKTCNCIRVILDYYESVVPQLESNTKLLAKCRETLRSTSSRDMLVPLDFSAKEELELLRLFHARNYNKIFSLVGYGYPEFSLASVDILEIGLRAALAADRGKLVLGYYSVLGKKNVRRAVFFNSDVEPYILQLNKKRGKERRSSFSDNLVSRIWELPVALENPVDRVAKRVAGNYQEEK